MRTLCCVNYDVKRARILLDEPVFWWSILSPCLGSPGRVSGAKKAEYYTEEGQER